MNKLFYKKQAKYWREALPLGNGKIGVMAYGGRHKDLLSFNNSSLWSGTGAEEPRNSVRKNLSVARDLLFNGEFNAAHELTKAELNGGWSEAYMPLGDVKISFAKKSVRGYRRELDLDTALHTVSFKGEKRTCFVSYPDNVAVYRVESDEPISLSVSLNSKLRSKSTVEGELLCIAGNAPDRSLPQYVSRKTLDYTKGEGMAFAMVLKTITDGKMSFEKSKLHIKGAKRVTFVITTKTGYLGWNKKPNNSVDDIKRQCIKQLNKVDCEYDVLLEKHLKDYQKLFNRQSFSLCAQSEMNTLDLLNTAKQGKTDPALIQLFYNYGKYLLIAGSRKGGQPTTLQGIWNASTCPPWSSNYTVNINTQMNYWPVSASNLSECAYPLIDFCYELMQAGQKTASVNYGCRGGCCNHNTDVWRKTTPVGGEPCWLYEPLCGAWLVNEAYSHYKNGLNITNEYKQKLFEAVRQSALFVNDYLVEHNGQYVIVPSTSPENNYFDSKGKKSAVDIGTAFDMQVARVALQNYLEVEPNGEIAGEVSEKLAALKPLGVGKYGLMEWSRDFKPEEIGHRHFSPLYCFYPADTVKYYADERLREACRELYHIRTENWQQYIGWSAAWAICLAGRLHEPKTAESVIDNMLANSVFGNLFDMHPPFLFQIDGNYGFVAGVNELLCYTENGVSELLPACPQSWQKGRMKNLLVGGVQLSFAWENGSVTEISADKPIKIMNKNLSEKCKLNDNVSVQ